MKKYLCYIFCGFAVVLTLLLRAAVYDITPAVESSGKESVAHESKDVPVTVHYHERRPYYISHGNEVKGLVAEPVSRVFEAAGIDIRWVRTPAKRQLEIIEKDEEVACAIGWFKTPERQQFGKFTLPVFQDRPFVAVARADNSLLQDRENLSRIFRESRLRLLIKDGYSYGKYIDERIVALNPSKIVTGADNAGMMKMIRTYRADYCFMTEEEAYDLLLFAGFNKADFKIVPIDDIPQGSRRYLICSKKFKDGDIDRLNAAIRHFLNIPETD